MIWDKIISESDKFRPYLNFIFDQEDALEVAKKNVSKVKGELHKKSAKVAQNAFNFLSNFSEEQTSKYGIPNRVAIISGARKVVRKHRMLDNVHAKIDIIDHKFKEGIELFKPLVSREIPFFQEEK